MQYRSQFYTSNRCGFQYHHLYNTITIPNYDSSFDKPICGTGLVTGNQQDVTINNNNLHRINTGNERVRYGMYKAILCGVLKSDKVRRLIIGYRIQGDILEIKLKIPNEYKDIIECLNEGMRPRR